MAKSSTSNTRVDWAGMTGGKPRSPEKKSEKVEMLSDETLRNDEVRTNRSPMQGGW